MHANKREEIKEVNAGDIAAAVGLKSVTTGDTLCDEKKPIILEKMEFPEPVISLAIEPKTKADQEKLGQGMAKLMAEDPTFRVRTDEQTNQVVIAGMGELHLEIIVDRLKREFGVEASVGKPQVAYKETITQPAEGEGLFKRADRRPRPVRPRQDPPVSRCEPGTGYQFENKTVGGSIPQGVHQADRPGHPGSADARHPRRLPDRRRAHRALRRLVPRRRLVGNGVQDRRLAGVQGCREEGAPVLLEPVMRVEVVVPKDNLGDVIGDLASRRGRIQSQEDRGGTQIISARVPLSRHVRLRHRPALAHAGPRDLLDALRSLRAGAAQRERRSHRAGAGHGVQTVGESSEPAEPDEDQHGR